MSANQFPDAIPIEIGRINSALREILTELGLDSSTQESTLDRVVVVKRDEGGLLETVDTGPPNISLEASQELDRFCRMIVAGTNLVGSVSIRARVEDSRPIFVRLWTTE
jgi:hypothetical protein